MVTDHLVTPFFHYYRCSLWSTTSSSRPAVPGVALLTATPPRRLQPTSRPTTTPPTSPPTLTPRTPSLKLYNNKPHIPSFHGKPFHVKNICTFIFHFSLSSYIRFLLSQKNSFFVLVFSLHNFFFPYSQAREKKAIKLYYI